MIMSNQTYDRLKWVASIGLPALATFVVTFTGIWGIPYGEPIGASIMAVDALLGAWLNIKSKKYANDQLVENESEVDE